MNWLLSRASTVAKVYGEGIPEYAFTLNGFFIQKVPIPE
jgi:hypothetical protein